MPFNCLGCDLAIRFVSRFASRLVSRFEQAFRHRPQPLPPNPLVLSLSKDCTGSARAMRIPNENDPSTSSG